MTQTTGYDDRHAESEGQTPPIDVWPNQHPDRRYSIRITVPEFTSMCPKTGQPDFATVTIVYEPDALCVELKSFKLYVQAYRNMGIFFENVANKILNEFVAACKPHRAVVVADFNPRGGIRTAVRVSYPFQKTER